MAEVEWQRQLTWQLTDGRRRGASSASYWRARVKEHREKMERAQALLSVAPRERVKKAEAQA